jgi:hypothetical protein
MNLDFTPCTMTPSMSPKLRRPIAGITPIFLLRTLTAPPFHRASAFGGWQS